MEPLVPDHCEFLQQILVENRIILKAAFRVLSILALQGSEEID
jgi:hypothetical protein